MDAQDGKNFDYLRRKRDACLYCDNPPETWEHIVPEAIGGRLGTHLLCKKHYQIEADHRFAERFGAMTQLMNVHRQDGRVSATIVLEREDGSGKMRLFEDGTMEIPTEVVRDEGGKFVRVTGEIQHVPELRKQIAGNDPEYKAPPTFQLVPRPPILVADYGFGPQTWPTVVKIALHFVAAFDSGEDPPQALIEQLRPIIYGEPSVPNNVSVTLEREPYFTAGLRDAHEVACFDGGDHVTVGIALYGVFRCIVRLDGMRCSRTLRYVQGLDGAPPMLTEEPLISLPWRQANDVEQGRWMDETQERISDLTNLQINRFYDRKVRDALPVAYGKFIAHAFDFKNPAEGIAYHLRAELEITIPDRDDLEIVLAEALSRPKLIDEALLDALLIRGDDS